MTKTVMISGSSSIQSLNPEVICSLRNIISLKFNIIIGDCYGVDTLVQRYLKNHNYTQVKVYHIGKKPRNNLGFETITVQGKRYSDKDKVMCEKADFGLAIWDGKSKGTKDNIQRVQKTKIIKY